LVLAEKIELAKDLGVIAPEFHDTFKKFKEFRNYMHPLAELKDRHPLDIGLGQIALGLMNHTISKLQKIRFIEENREFGLIEQFICKRQEGTIVTPVSSSLLIETIAKHMDRR
jgi:hypothetical protein